MALEVTHAWMELFQEVARWHTHASVLNPGNLTGSPNWTWMESFPWSVGVLPGLNNHLCASQEKKNGRERRIFDAFQASSLQLS